MRVGDWSVDPGLNQIRRDDETIRLEPKVMEVLTFLGAHPGEVVSREVLLDALWPGMVVGDDSLTQSVIKLRKALGDDPRNPTYIQTIPKRGYRLLARFSHEDSKTEDSHAAGGKEHIARPSQPVRPNVGLRPLALAGLVLAFLVAGWLIWTHPNLLFSPGGKHIVADQPASIVVLPFANLSDDPAQEYFSDGITGDLTTDLSRLGSLWVIARQTALSYKGRAVKISDVAHDLGVRYVVDGSVQRLGSRVRINIQLTDASNGHQVWAERFDRQIGDLFTIQDEIEQQLVASLKLTLSDQERRRLAHRYTSNIEAYDLFLRGQQAYVRQTADDNNRAQAFLRSAIALDPKFARAYAALALTDIDDWRFQWSHAAEQGADKALRMARHAVDLDDDLPQAHWALGFVHVFRREHAEAIRAARHALDLDPKNADAVMTLAFATAYSGDPEQALGLISTAMKLNPQYGATYRGGLGQTYFLAGRYGEAVPVLEQAIENNPSRLQARLMLAATYIKLGNQSDAEWQAGEILAIQPEFTLNKIERIAPFRTDAELEAYKTLLRKAGLK
jgi:adenylate cyclase